MFCSCMTLRHTVILGGLFALLSLLTIAPSSSAEPSALDETPSAKEEKKPITVPAGTPIMVRTVDKVSSSNKAGYRFAATLEANLLAADKVVADAGTQVYGQVISVKSVGRGIVVQHSDLVLSLTQINIEGTMYPLQTGSFSEQSTGVILKRGSVTIPKGTLLQFALTQPLIVKK